MWRQRSHAIPPERSFNPLSFLIFSNIFVSCCAASLVLATWAELGLEVSIVDPMVGLVFFATLLVYNLDRVIGTSPEDADGDSERHGWIERRRRALLGLVAFSGSGTLLMGLLLEWKIFAALIPLGLLSITYSLPILPGREQGWRRLKDVPGLKIFLIALVWGVATVTLPAWHREVLPWSAEPLWLMGERALFIFIITLPFDVRDLERDARAGVRTLPHLLGVERTRALAIAMLCFFMASATVRHQAAGFVWPLAMTTMLTGALLARLDTERSESYYVIYMEGTMLLQTLLVLGWWFSMKG